MTPVRNKETSIIADTYNTSAWETSIKFRWCKCLVPELCTLIPFSPSMKAGPGIWTGLVYRCLMKRSHSFQSFLHPSPPSSLPDTSPPQPDASPFQDSVLFPPFYGRPYHLPPSPSFTELLKPQWRKGTSTTSQRPRDGAVASGATTPESSDDEILIAKASKFAQSHTGKSDVGAVGTNEYYGFALYLGSTVALGMSSFLLVLVLMLCSFVHWVGFFPIQSITFHRRLLLS